MQSAIEWIMNNKEWIFSGIGVFVLGFFIVKNRGGQTQKSGDNSVNIQAGKNVDIGNKDD